MRVSEFYNLDRTQPTLEFIDVDITNDIPIFIDPRALRYINSNWGRECVSIIQNFFQHIITLMRTGRHSEARALLSVLSEPNETHLGYSTGRSRGRAMGRQRATNLWRKLNSSRAIQTGLIADLEETALFIETINVDVISDIATNLIREPLVKFTQDMCKYYGIPMQNAIGLGRTWDPRQRRWESKTFDLPLTSEGVILLVPKSVVRKRGIIDAEEYYRHHVAPFLQEQELNAGSSIVETLKNGNRRVTKKSVKEKYGATKETSLATTINNQDILDQYRAEKTVAQDALGHSAIADATSTEIPDWASLLQDVLNTPAGREHASIYHNNVEKLLSAVFYPALDYPNKEYPLHNGRKRIDITYTNIAASGFFYKLPTEERITASAIPVECKNYSTDVENPELDQLSGRFGANFSWFGILVCRTMDNKPLIRQRCKDTASDDRGYVIVLDDNDLQELVQEKMRDPDSTRFALLDRLFNELIT